MWKTVQRNVVQADFDHWHGGGAAEGWIVVENILVVYDVDIILVTVNVGVSNELRIVGLNLVVVSAFDFKKTSYSM
jgi:hypothetical protein